MRLRRFRETAVNRELLTRALAIVIRSAVWLYDSKILMRRDFLASGDHVLIQIVDSALADVTHRSGEWLVCRPGCTQCCIGAFPINQLDAMRLRRGLAELESSAPVVPKLFARGLGMRLLACPRIPGRSGKRITGRRR